MREDCKVRLPADLRNMFAENCIHLVGLPVSDDVLARLRADAFGVATSTNRLLIVSASDADFSWELTNKLILTTPTVEEVDAAECSATARFGSADSVISLIPALLEDPARLPDDLPGPRCAVILARKNATTIAEVDAVAQLITKVGFTIRAVVIIDCDNRRWRRWRRFSLAFGVGSDPERPWPTIDVLEEEKRRSAESTRHGHVRRR